MQKSRWQKTFFASFAGDDIGIENQTQLGKVEGRTIAGPAAPTARPH